MSFFSLSKSLKFDIASFIYINLVQSISDCPFSQITRNKLSFTYNYYLAKSHHRYLDLTHVLLKITNWDYLLGRRDPHVYYCLTQHSCKAEITQQEKQEQFSNKYSIALNFFLYSLFSASQIGTEGKRMN